MISIKNNDKLFKGFFTVCHAVSQTMGAQGKLSVMENEMLGNPVVTKDGISTAKKIFFRDNQENMGAHLAKQVAAKTLVTAGDSTTTSLVFAKALVTGSRKPFTRKYFYNKRVEQGMDKAYEDFCQLIEDYSQKVDDEAIRKIATVSSNNNHEIGQLVFDAYKAVGDKGVIDVKQVQNLYKSNLEVSNGMKIEAGWENPFLTNNSKNARFEGEGAVVIIYEGYLGGDEVVQKTLQKIKDVNSDTPIVIVAERFHEDTLIKLVDLHQRRVLNLTAVQCPEYDVKRKALLEDIATYTGGKVFLQGGEDKEIIYGMVDKVIVTESTCSFIKEDIPEAVQIKIEELEAQKEQVTDKDFIEKRIQNLRGVSATINVGGVGESEIKEKFDRVEDAVCSIQSAQEEGWIAGGGSALAYISNNMKRSGLSKEEKFGYNIVVKALLAPMKQICINANRNPRKYLKASQRQYGIGYNAYTDKQSNLIRDNIIDSTKSIRTALENALSVTKLLLNTGVVITLNTKEEN